MEIPETLNGNCSNIKFTASVFQRTATELSIPQQVNADGMLSAPWCLHSTGHPLILLTGCFCCILGV